MKKRMMILCMTVAFAAFSLTAYAQSTGDDVQYIENDEGFYEADDGSIEVETELETVLESTAESDEVTYYETDSGYNVSRGTNASWQDAFLDVVTDQPHDGMAYALIYVDDDDIPELLCYTGVEAGGCQIYTWHDTKLNMLQTSRLGYTYIEKGNQLCNSDGNMGGYFDMIYTIDDSGEWVLTDNGVYGTDDGIDYYKWNGFDVTREEYSQMMEEAYDVSLAISADVYYTAQEMASLLQTGEPTSNSHRYEVFREDVSWTQAQEKCKQKGGYLAVLTSQEEFDEVSQLIKNVGYQNCSIWVGGSSKYSTQTGFYWIAPDAQYNMIETSFLPFWMDGEPSYTGYTESGQSVTEDSVSMLYNSAKDRFYLNDAPDDILSAAPSYAGIIAYVCEWDA